MQTLKTLILFLVIVAAGMGIYLYTGSYPIGADVPHTKLVSWLLQTTRDRAIDVASQDIEVPADLNDPERVSIGAGQYAAMCSGCHLAPGFENNETRAGLYPKPPRLAEDSDLTASHIFWVLKHGLKMTGMPAWGVTHSDKALWDITAFVQQLPKLNAQQYRDIVIKAPMDDDMTAMPMPQGEPVEGHEHDHDHEHEHEATE